MTKRRPVAELEPDQLARKRANDREAQRAMRARTRGYIERLETELKNLRGLLCHDDAVQALWDQNKALVAELASLRATLRAHSTALQQAEAQNGRYAPGRLYDDCGGSTTSDLSRSSDGLTSIAQTVPSGSLWQSPTSHTQPMAADLSPHSEMTYCLVPPQMDCCQRSVISESHGKMREISTVPWTPSSFNNMGIGVEVWDTSSISGGLPHDSHFWPISNSDQVIRSRV